MVWRDRDEECSRFEGRVAAGGRRLVELFVVELICRPAVEVTAAEATDCSCCASASARRGTEECLTCTALVLGVETACDQMAASTSGTSISSMGGWAAAGEGTAASGLGCVGRLSSRTGWLQIARSGPKGLIFVTVGDDTGVF